MSERVTAMFLVAATGPQSSIVVGVATADEALAKMREFRAEGLATVVLDGFGPERATEELQAGAAPTCAQS